MNARALDEVAALDDVALLDVEMLTRNATTPEDLARRNSALATLRERGIEVVPAVDALVLRRGLAW